MLFDNEFIAQALSMSQFQDNIKWKHLHRLYTTQAVNKDQHFIAELSEAGFDGIPNEHRSWVWSLLLSIHVRSNHIFFLI